jgi:hypothetical protein
MTDNIHDVLAERGQRYGKFTGHAMIAQTIKNLMRGNFNEVCARVEHSNDECAIRNKWTGLAPDQQEALDMIAHKIARILNGDPNYADSWVDIAGYAQLVADRLNNTGV